MAYQDYGDWNKTGLDQMFVYVADVEPIFVPMLLFSFFTIILLATFFSQKRLGSDGDLAASFAVAGYATFVFALIMSLIEGLIPTTMVVLTLVIAVIGTLFLYFSKRR